MFDFDKTRQAGREQRRKTCSYQKKNEFGVTSGVKKPVFSLPKFPGETVKEASRRLKFFEKVVKVQDGFQAFETKEDYEDWKTSQDKNTIVVDYDEVREMFEEDDELLEEFDDLFGY